MNRNVEVYSRPEECICEKFAYLPHMAGYTKLTSYIPELSEIVPKHSYAPMHPTKEDD